MSEWLDIINNTKPTVIQGIGSGTEDSLSCKPR